MEVSNERKFPKKESHKNFNKNLALGKATVKI